MIKNLCIIPARGGSKRIPRKNIKRFMGKPIIAYSIEAAVKSGLFEKVVVSTDDQEIAKIARTYGADVPFMRSAETAGDFATTVDVLLEVLKEIKPHRINYEHICCLYPTAPFINTAKLAEAYKKLVGEHLDAVFPVIPFSYPIQRSLQVKNGKVKFFFPEFENARSQDLEKAYHDAGQFYFIRTKNLISNKSIISENAGSIIISEMEAQDIDTETDWKLAELKYEILQSS